MNAQEARDISYNAQLSGIFKRIQTAASKGQYHIDFYEIMEQQTAAALRDAGFLLEDMKYVFYLPYQELSFTRISW